MSINLLTQSKVSPVELTLPSGKSVAIPRCGYVFSPWRGTPILDTYGGKAVLDWSGNPVFAELAILGVFERAGWDGVWLTRIEESSDAPCRQNAANCLATLKKCTTASAGPAMEK